MPLSLEDILNKPELEASVSIDWVKAELVKQPYNQYLKGLLARKSNKQGASPLFLIKSFVDSIVADAAVKSGSPYYLRDVELDLEPTFAQANKIETKEDKENKITSAAIGAGAIVVGSIASRAEEASHLPEIVKVDPVSQTDQIEESGLLGFLNRLDGTVKRSEPTAAMDPMRKEGNFRSEVLEVDNEISDVNDEKSQTIDKLQEPKVEDKIGKEGVAKKKKKVKVKANKGLRWSSMTSSDYKIKKLDPFTVWINSIDGVKLEVASEGKKPKKSKGTVKKKKKKKGKHLDSLRDKPEIASEQLADLLVNQGHIQQAITMYERLSLKYPEKSSFFAGKIDTIKDKL